MLAEALVLQKLHHRGQQRLGDAVDLVQKQYAARAPRLLHIAIDPGDDFGHGVFRDRRLRAAEAAPHDLRQTQRALARVVRQRVGNQPHVQPPGHLRRRLGLAHARRAQQIDRPLRRKGNQRQSLRVPRSIGPQRQLRLADRLSNVHRSRPLRFAFIFQTPEFSIFEILPARRRRRVHHQPPHPAGHVDGVKPMLQEHERRLVFRRHGGKDPAPVREEQRALQPAQLTGRDQRVDMLEGRGESRFRRRHRAPANRYSARTRADRRSCRPAVPARRTESRAD